MTRVQKENVAQCPPEPCPPEPCPPEHASLITDTTSIGYARDLGEYALAVDLESIHPARLFVMRAAINEELKVAEAQDMMLLQRAFYRTLPAAKLLIDDYQEAIRNNHFCKAALLEALNFSLSTSKSIEKFFSFVLSPELFNSSAARALSDPEIPSHCFDFVSFCPLSVVRAIAARGQDSIESFHDLGCGPGSIMFVVALLTDAKVVGTELSSEWCKKGEVLAKSISRPDIDFINRNLVDGDYSFGGAQVYYCYSPFIWKVPETYLFAKKIASSMVGAASELWMGDYRPMCEVIDEATELQLVARYDRLTVYR